MNATENVQFSFIVCHTMTITDIRSHFLAIIYPLVCIRLKIKAPKVIEPRFSLPTKNIHELFAIIAASTTRAAYWTI
jgi:hypothetical protein